MNETIILKGATLFDGTDKEPLMNSVIIIKNDIIESVSQDNNNEQTFDGDVIDVSDITFMWLRYCVIKLIPGACCHTVMLVQ